MRAWLRGFAIVSLALAIAGCFLRLTVANVFVETISEGVETVFASVDAESTVAVCNDGYSIPSTEPSRAVECDYFVEGSSIGSSASFASTLGLFGVIVDPLVMQVPATATDIRATYTRDGVSGNLAVVEFTGAIPVDSTRRIVPEPGRRLIVLDFPTDAPAVGGAPYQYHFDFRARVPRGEPITVKAVFAARVTNSGQTFYAPLMPCVTDLSLLPPLTLPRAATPQPISLTGQPTPRGCNGVQYRMTPKALPTVDVVEYYNAALDHYFITWIASEIAILDAGTQTRGWIRTGKLFNGYSGAQTATTALCRYYLPPAYGDSHFFGRGATECADTGTQHPQFVLEDASYLHMFLPYNGICPSGTTSVYRVFSNRADANHRYTTDRAVRDAMVSAGWLAEGDGNERVVMCAPA
jgi:hypothetical protein